MSQCNATSLSSRLFAMSQTGLGRPQLLGCADTSQALLLDMQLASAATAGLRPPLQVLSLAASTTSSHITPSVNTLEALTTAIGSVVSSSSQALYSSRYSVVDMLQVVLNIQYLTQSSAQYDYWQQLQISAETYLSRTQSNLERVASLLSITLAADASLTSPSLSAQLLQRRTAAAAVKHNTLVTSPQFQDELLHTVYGGFVCPRGSTGTEQFAFNITTAVSIGGAVRRTLQLSDTSSGTLFPKQDPNSLRRGLQQNGSHLGACSSITQQCPEGLCLGHWYGYQIRHVGSDVVLQPQKQRRNRRRAIFSKNVIVGGLLLHGVSNSSFWDLWRPLHCLNVAPVTCLTPYHVDHRPYTLASENAAASLWQVQEHACGSCVET